MFFQQITLSDIKKVQHELCADRISVTKLHDLGYLLSIAKSGRDKDVVWKSDELSAFDLKMALKSAI